MLRCLPLALLLSALLLSAACGADRPGAVAAETVPAPSIATPATPAPAEPPPPTLPRPKLADPVPVPTPPSQPPAAGTLVLAAGGQADIGREAQLRYDRLANDSRCPAGVQCIWAGEVRLALTLTVAGKSEPFELASAREQRRTVQGYSIELLDFGPCPLDHGTPGQECASLKSTPPAP